jgi:hypothetical protein
MDAANAERTANPADPVASKKPKKEKSEFKARRCVLLFQRIHPHIVRAGTATITSRYTVVKTGIQASDYK